MLKRLWTILVFVLCVTAFAETESSAAVGAAADSSATQVAMSYGDSSASQSSASQIAADPSAPGVEKFHSGFMLRFLINYNFMSFWSSEFRDAALVSNRPVDVGLGLGYGDFYWDFLFALPFTTNDKHSKSFAFDTGFDFFPGDWWLKGKLRTYSGFSADVDSNSVYVDLVESEAYISALWLGTSKGEFTPQAAYFLDRRQKHSAGSLILGGRLQATWTKDRDSTLAYYQELRKFFSGWADMGYSYTWVYSNDMFVNVWGVVGVASGIGDGADDNKDFMLLPEAMLKFAYGYIDKQWSWNTVMEVEYMPVVFSDHWEQKLVCAYKILVVRRF